MKAVYLDSGKISVRDVPVPARPPGFALIRMMLAGICNTDLELQRGYYAFGGIPGHEFVGEVLESDDAHLIGKRVVGEINLPCGHCDFCATGLGRHCRNRSVLGIVRHPGAFAECLLLPNCNLHVIPARLPSEHAVFVEPIAAACEILDQVQIACGERVAVLGDGKLGLLIAQVLQAHGAQVMVFGRHEQKLQLARSRGIETCVSIDRPVAAFEIVVDATGSSAGLREAVSMVRPRGTLVMKSTVHGEVSIDTAAVIVNELTLVGSRCGRFEPALDLLDTGRVHVAPMISGEYRLDQAPLAFTEASRSGVLKILLRNDQ